MQQLLCSAQTVSRKFLITPHTDYLGCQHDFSHRKAANEEVYLGPIPGLTVE